MNACIAALLLLSCVAAFTLPAAAGEAGRKLLAEVMEKPGGWQQMCSPLEPTPFEAPVPVYSGSLLPRYFELGDKDAIGLQTQRAEILPALRETLAAMDLAKPPKVTRGWNDPGEGGGTRAGFKLDWLNPLHLRIVRELNAVEALPELLRLEAQLHGLLATGEKDAKAALPDLPLDASIFPERPGAKYAQQEFSPALLKSAEFKRDTAVLTCRIFQRELLGTITVLLRHESFVPAIEKLEPVQRESRARLADAVTAAKAKLAEAEKRHAATKEKSTQEELNSSQFEMQEAVRKLQWADEHPEDGFEAAYTPALRSEIRTLAEAFLKTVPPENRKAAAAMPKHDVAK